MKKPKPFALLATVAAGLAFAAHAGEHAHEHAHRDPETPQKLELNAGKKWASDAVLRQAMGNINQAMTKALPRIQQARFTDTDYHALAAAVNREIAYAIEHCQLEPEADAMLHLVIADLGAGAAIMAGEGQASRHDGAKKVLRALKAYGQYFAHPGWKSAGA